MKPIAPQTDVSLPRLYALRAMYLFIVLGFGAAVLPNIVHPQHGWALMEGVVNCMLVSFWVLSALGLRYPLQMLPVLFWEFIWKALWLAVVAWPQYRSGHMDDGVVANAYACALAVLIPIVVPWRYVWAHYLKKAGDPWSRRVNVW